MSVNNSVKTCHISVAKLNSLIKTKTALFLYSIVIRLCRQNRMHFVSVRNVFKE